MTRLREHYKEVVRDALLEQFSYGNSMEIPRLEKIVINMGVGDATQDRKKTGWCSCGSRGYHRSEAYLHGSEKVGSGFQTS
jgi:hypothetical protein